MNGHLLSAHAQEASHLHSAHDLALDAVIIFSVDDLVRFLKSNSASALLKVRKLAAAYRHIDFYNEEEVRRLAAEIPKEIIGAVQEMNGKNPGDIAILMSLCPMINDFFSKFELNCDVLDALAAEIAVIVDPRQYDMWAKILYSSLDFCSFRWHSSADELNDYIEDRKKMITRCLSNWMRPRMMALLGELLNDRKEVPSREQMQTLTNYFQKYESMFIGFQNYECKTPCWKNATAFLKRFIRADGLFQFPHYMRTELAQQLKWIVKMFLFEWADPSFEMLSKIFSFVSVQIYEELNKHQATAEVDCETLEQWTFVIEQGICYMHKVKRNDGWFGDDEIIQCLQQLHKALFYMIDYVVACLNRNIEIKRTTRLIIVNCYSKFAKHGNVVEVEKKYGKRVTEWLYRNARRLLASVDDTDYQIVVYATESLLINASNLTALPIDVCFLLADYVRFEYVEHLKGIDIDRAGTLYASRDLFNRDDWYTEEGLREVIKASLKKKPHISTYQTHQTNLMVAKLQKKLEKPEPPKL